MEYDELMWSTRPGQNIDRITVLRNTYLTLSAFAVSVHYVNATVTFGFSMKVQRLSKVLRAGKGARLVRGTTVKVEDFSK